MGPTTKLPSLGHIGFDAMLQSYEEQAAALIEGGVDLLLIETAQDLLQAKIATIAVLEAMRKAGKRLPVQVQVTLQESGTMLLGTEIGAALTALEPFEVDAIGLNCATGPKEMNDAVRYLALNSTKEVSVLPNAGLPQNVGGHAVYKLSPADLAEYHRHFVKDYGVRIVGGCCGTTPEHLKAVVDAVSGVEPAKREVKRAGAASSAYTTVPLDLEPKPLIVAEEMNTTTRVEHFRKLVQGKKYDDILGLAKKLVNEGSHMLDLCDRGGGREGIHNFDSGKNRNTRSSADSRGFDRGRRCGRGAEAYPRAGHYQFDQSGRWRKEDIASIADGQAVWGGRDRADYRRRRHGVDC
jgi:5-methyltetrahydrofolate--homocysteine methyltransferase